MSVVVWERKSATQAMCAKLLEQVSADAANGRHDTAQQLIQEAKNCGAPWRTQAEDILVGARAREGAMGCKDHVLTVEQHLKSSNVRSAQTSFQAMAAECRATEFAQQLSLALEKTQAAADMAEIQVRRSLAKGEPVSAAAQFNRLVTFNREQPGIEQLRQQVLDAVKAKGP